MSSASFTDDCTSFDIRRTVSGELSMSRARLVRRLVGPTAIASLVLAPALLPAQATSAIDPRFQPWIGCWRPIDSGLGLEELDGDKQPTRACVVPSTTTTGSVELMLFHRDSLMSRTVMPTPGRPLARRIDECDGVESAEWTPGNARLVLKAELTCARGVKRVETGMLTMNDAGQWVQFQHLAVGKNEATTVARFRFEGDSVLPAGVDMGRVRSTRALRLAAGGAIEATDVIDVAKLVPTSLAEGWLSELGPRLALDSRTLVQLADGGVPPRVIDVMVALANPDKFQIGPAMTNARGASQGPNIATLRTGRATSAPRSRCELMDDFCYGPGGMGAWGLGYRYGLFDPWGYGYFNPYRYGMGGMGWNAYSPWGGSYGWGGGWGYGGYYGGGPVVIVPSNTGASASSSGPVRGRAVSGGGYTRDNPEPRTPATYTPPSSGTAGGSAGGTSGGSSGGDGGGRTAKPRGSGGL
ncbi:hypothetical protein [Gemmatimonas sp.]|uniref:hypothetical protein n=1 Tax=Gemmatimonas sp. TaxID=1962908 RepID=UPI0027B9B9A1|nr:hypothetical protein [Gemmatimonas sp.]